MSIGTGNPGSGLSFFRKDKFILEPINIPIDAAIAEINPKFIKLYEINND